MTKADKKADKKWPKLEKAYNGSSLANTRMDGLASLSFYV